MRERIRRRVIATDLQGADTEIARQQHINLAVADHQRVFAVESMFGVGLFEHANGGFAAAALLLRRMWTVVNPVQRYAFGTKQLLQAPMDGLHLLIAEIAPANS